MVAAAAAHRLRTPLGLLLVAALILGVIFLSGLSSWSPVGRRNDQDFAEAVAAAVLREFIARDTDTRGESSPGDSIEATSDAGPASGSDNYFAMCLAIKDLHRDIKEWLAHHRFVGASRVYLYDTGSNPPLNDTIREYINSGFVEYNWVIPDFGDENNKRRPQMEIWRECLGKNRRRHQFLAFTDSDEFLILRDRRFKTIPQFLQHMQEDAPVGGLVVNWVVFGTGGWNKRPTKGVLQAYTKCLPFRNAHAAHFKTIVNTDYALRPRDPHSWVFSDGFYAINEHGLRMDGPRYANYTVDYIALYHYTLKSVEEFDAKRIRGTAMGNHKGDRFFQSIERQATESCVDAAQRYGPY